MSDPRKEAEMTVQELKQKWESAKAEYEAGISAGVNKAEEGRLIKQMEGAYLEYIKAYSEGITRDR